MAGSKYFKARIKREFAPLVEDMADDAARETMRKIGEKIKERAKNNVNPGESPGMHPGPHPHVTEHEDTGLLSDSIGYRVEKQGPKGAKKWLVTVGVLNNERAARYGTALEIGFTLTKTVYSRYGEPQSVSRFTYQYPWLWPAVQDTQDEFDAIIKTEFDVFFRGKLQSGKKGYIYIGPGDIEGSETPV